MISVETWYVLLSTILTINKRFFDFIHQPENFGTIERAANEQLDTAILAITSKILITNSIITNNDLFLSASTESTATMKNNTISGISAKGSII